jgi:hypothetical protein
MDPIKAPKIPDTHVAFAMAEKKDRTHSDNVLVKRGRQSAEFLAVMFWDSADPDAAEVLIYRYCVPGRCDTYSFSVDRKRRGGAMLFTSDGQTTLPAGLKLLHEDLEKPAVRELLKQAIALPGWLYYARQLEALLVLLAPKSKTTRACSRQLQGILDARRAARIAAEHEAAANRAAHTSFAMAETTA